ncbi:unnamed protein product [Coregonus sp. 'balchen']|nr:unnamed protein product [Coregonus sp. 'balchen']
MKTDAGQEQCDKVLAVSDVTQCGVSCDPVWCLIAVSDVTQCGVSCDPESSGPDSQQVTEKENGEVTAPATKVATPEPDVEAITKTVTSTLSMQEYFAQRMAQLKKGRGESPTATSSPESSDGQQVPADFVTDDTEELTSKKKKKKKKRKREREEDEVVVKEECDVAPVSEECEKKKKKKKKKRAEKGVLAEDCSATTGVEQNCEDDQTVDVTESEVVNKKRRNQEEEVAVEDEEEVIVVKEKKSKNKKKRKEHL